MLHDRSGCVFSYISDPQTCQQLKRFIFLRFFDCLQHSDRSFFFAKYAFRNQFFFMFLQLINVCKGFHISCLDQCIDDRISKPHNVHCIQRAEIGNRSCQLCRAKYILTADICHILILHQDASTDRTSFRCLKNLLWCLNASV